MFGRLINKPVLAIDWDIRRVRFVHAIPTKGGVDIERVFSVEIPSDIDVSSPESLGGFIGEVLKQQKIRTDRAVMDVPRDQVLLSTLKLPSASPDELPAIVEFQIAKEIHFSPTEAVVDFAVYPSQEGGKLDALVATAREEVLDYYRHTCKAANLKLERIGLRPYANKIAVSEMLGSSRPERVVFVDVGPNLMEIDVIKSGRLVFSRAASAVIPKGLLETPDAESAEGDASGPDADSDETSEGISRPASLMSGFDLSRVIESLLVEITRSVEAYRATDAGAAIDLVVVGGSVGVEPLLSEAIKRRFDCRVEFYDPAPQFGWPASRGEQTRGFASILGLTLGHASTDKLQFDFLHPKKPVTESERRRKKAPAWAVAACLFVGAGLVFYFTYVGPQKSKLEATNDKIHQLKKSMKDLGKIEKRIEYVEQFEEEQVVWVDELDRVLNLLPRNEEMRLKNLNMHQKGARLTFALECTDESKVHDTVARINEFKIDGSEEPYYRATAGGTKRTSGRYPVSSSIDVEVLNKIESD